MFDHSSVSEFPWDVHLRGVTAWNNFFKPGRPTEWEKANNNMSIRDMHHCTGVLYSDKVILTAEDCLREVDWGAEAVISTGNRYAIWLARGRYQTQRWLMFTDKNEDFPNNFSQNCEFKYAPDSSGAAFKFANNVAAITLFDPIPKDLWARKGEYAALELAPPGMDFSGLPCFHSYHIHSKAAKPYYINTFVINNYSNTTVY